MNRPDDKAVPVACSLEEASDWIRLAHPSKSHVFVRICFSVSFAGTVTRFFSLSNLTNAVIRTVLWNDRNRTRPHVAKRVFTGCVLLKTRFFFWCAEQKKQVADDSKTSNGSRCGKPTDVSKQQVVFTGWPLLRKSSLSAHVRKPWSAPLVCGEVRCEKLEFLNSVVA